MKNKLLLLCLFPVSLFAQWNYVSLIGDNCIPILKANYTFSNYNIGSHGYGYNIYKDGVRINDGSGDMGCCSIVDLQAISDTVIFKIVNNAGVNQIYKSVNSGKSWTFFDGVQLNAQKIIYLNQNTGYVLVKNYIDNSLEITRLSDIKRSSLVSKDTVDISKDTEEITDTIFGEPLCKELKKIGFRIQKNGINKDYVINITSNPLALKSSILSASYLVYPNPFSDYLSIKTEADGIITISDIQGRSLFTEELKVGTNQIRMDNLKKGIYFLVIQNNMKNEIIKIMKE